MQGKKTSLSLTHTLQSSVTYFFKQNPPSVQKTPGNPKSLKLSFNLPGTAAIDLKGGNRRNVVGVGEENPLLYSPLLHHKTCTALDSDNKYPPSTRQRLPAKRDTPRVPALHQSHAAFRITPGRGANTM